MGDAWVMGWCSWPQHSQEVADSSKGGPGQLSGAVKTSKRTQAPCHCGGAREEGRVLSLKGRPSLNLHIRELIDSLALAAGWGKWSLRVWLSVKGGQAGRLNGHQAGVHLRNLPQQYWLLEVPRKGLAF